MALWVMWYRIENDSTTYATYTNANGKYAIYHDGADYVDIWMGGGTYQPHWWTYYECTNGNWDWDNPSPTIRVDADYSVPLSFVGSDYTP
jgi:hypothetical protein